MNRKLLLVIALVLIASCETKENSLDKSIIEPLTIEELRVEMEKDNMFQYSYNAVEKLRNETLTTDVLKAKYGNITYREVDQFYRYFKDTITFNNLERKFKDEWTKEYANVFSRVDSTVNYWKEYIEKNNLDINATTWNHRLKVIKSEIPYEVQFYLESEDEYNDRVWQDDVPDYYDWENYKKGFSLSNLNRRIEIAEKVLDERIQSSNFYFYHKLDSITVKKFGKTGEFILLSRR